MSCLALTGPGLAVWPLLTDPLFCLRINGLLQLLPHEDNSGRLAFVRRLFLHHSTINQEFSRLASSAHLDTWPKCQCSLSTYTSPCRRWFTTKMPFFTFPCRRWVAPRQTFTCPCRRWGATRLPIYSCPCIRWVATNLPTFTSPCRSWDTTRLPTFTCPCRRWGAPDCLQSPTASVQPTNWPCPASPAPCCGGGRTPWPSSCCRWPPSPAALARQSHHGRDCPRHELV